jgi:hypothetical protein
MVHGDCLVHVHQNRQAHRPLSQSPCRYILSASLDNLRALAWLHQNEGFVDVERGRCDPRNGRFRLLINSETSWGNRADGDIDNSERMTPRAIPAEVMMNPTPSAQALIRYKYEIIGSKGQGGLRLSKTAAYSEKESFPLPAVDNVD